MRAGEGVRYRLGMHRPAALTRTYTLDLVVALLAGVAMIDLVLRPARPGAPATLMLFALAAFAGLVLAVIARRRFPAGGPIAYWLLAASFSFVDPYLIPNADSFFAVGMAVAFLLGNLRNPGHGALGLVVVLAAAATIVYRIPGHQLSDLVFVPVNFGISWLGGFILRESIGQAEAAEARAALADQTRAAEALMAVVEERTRIARELHDVVGHAVSLMTVQTSGVRRLLHPDQEQEREALLAVERTGRETLAEMRRVVGVLRDADEAPALAPRPSLSQVHELVAHANDTGLAVDLEVEGEPIPLSAGIDLTAYRLVQEGLTNAIKHAAARHAAVRVSYEAGHVEIEVSDDGRGGGPDLSRGDGGHGLLGMRERVSIFGGEFESGPRPEGGYRLRARIPVTT
jgi:signal transduction histidine kinase